MKSIAEANNHPYPVQTCPLKQIHWKSNIKSLGLVNKGLTFGLQQNKTHPKQYAPGGRERRRKNTYVYIYTYTYIHAHTHTIHTGKERRKDRYVDRQAGN